jgi:drug/metabolite transporter (DMT)-like permease
LELFVVLGRLLFSSFANVFQKKLTLAGLHPFFIVMSSYVVLTAICIPLVWLIELNTLSETFWLNIFFAAALDMAGTLFLVMSLSKTDLSVFGPLNAYKVVISMLLAMVFIGEIPSMQGFVGVMIIVAGSYFLFPASADAAKANPLRLLLQKGVQYRFLSILLFSIGTLPLKQAVIAGGALATTVFWCVIGLPLAVLGARWVIGKKLIGELHHSRDNLQQFIALGMLIFLMQYMTMIVFAQLLVAYSLALFQLSMVLQVFLGHRIFNEPHLWQRLGACGVMVAGSLMVLST